MPPAAPLSAPGMEQPDVVRQKDQRGNTACGTHPLVYVTVLVSTNNMRVKNEAVLRWLVNETTRTMLTCNKDIFLQGFAVKD
jgi:hypothetical protein